MTTRVHEPETPVAGVRCDEAELGGDGDGSGVLPGELVGGPA
jgi:hypothetical protein